MCLVADNIDGSGDRIIEPGAHAAAEVSSNAHLSNVATASLCCSGVPVTDVVNSKLIIFPVEFTIKRF